MRVAAWWRHQAVFSTLTESSLKTGSIQFRFHLGSSQAKNSPCGCCQPRFRCRYEDFHNAERVPKVHRYKNLKGRYEKKR
nr:MAG TPA: hypothetical protein [Caudoviricetes sp.]